MTVGHVLLLAVAGVGAGLSGSLAGLASLFSYPALLAVGLPPTAANMTNTVSLLFSSIGSAVSSRVELTGQWPTVRRYAPLVALSGAAGAAALFLTPPGGFEKVVPFLVGGASVVLLLQPRIRAAAAESSHRQGPLMIAGLVGVGLYGGYFGAAAGVLLLALLAIGLPVSLLEANGLKNVLLGVANGAAAVAFAIFGAVAWPAVPPLALGVLAGSWLGPIVARRLPTHVLRVGVGLAGIGLAVALGLDAF